MYITLPNGQKSWIYFPEQCDLCKGFIFSDGTPCNRECTINLIKMLKEAEIKAKGVYGSVDFSCDYFNLDEDKYNNSRYNESSCQG